MASASDFYRVEEEPARGLVRVTRTDVRFPSLEEMKAAHDELAPIIRRLTGKKLLLDFSGGPPGRNDDAFESASLPVIRALEQTFEKVAVLVRTRAGELQVRRLAKQDHREPSVFFEEKDALRWLTG